MAVGAIIVVVINSVYCCSGCYSSGYKFPVVAGVFLFHWIFSFFLFFLALASVNIDGAGGRAMYDPVRPSYTFIFLANPISVKERKENVVMEEVLC